MIASGQVRVVREDESGTRAVIRLLGQGQYFGEASLLYGEPRNATVETIVPTTLLYIEQDDFRVMVEKLPNVRKQLEATAGRRSKVLGLDRFDWQPGETIMRRRSNVIPLFLNLAPAFWHVLAAALAVVSFIDSFRPAGGWQWFLRSWPS
jgi:signal-transduction protein with cAMP-binding, CBS, and nucleotidyltransferase domain